MGYEVFTDLSSQTNQDREDTEKMKQEIIVRQSFSKAVAKPQNNPPAKR